MPAAPLVDSHCHLTWPDFEGDVPAVLERMAAAHVTRAVVVATSVEDARRTKALAATSSLLVPTAGIHPNDLPEGLDDALAELRALVAAGGYVAVGDTARVYLGNARNITVAVNQTGYRRSDEEHTKDRERLLSYVEHAEYTVEVKNRKTEQIQMLVRQHLPSPDTELVEVIPKASSPRVGVLEWDLKIAPGEMKRLVYRTKRKVFLQ